LYNPTAGEIAMRSCNLIFVPLGVLFALGANADVTAKTPRVAAAHNANLVSQAERAIASFVAACATHDAPRLTSLTTDDVRIDYALEEPGTWLSLDAASLMAACATQTAATNRAPGLDNLRIFPTGDANAVFVQYDVAVGSDSAASGRQLALVEMRGERISRMLNYSGAPQSLLASTARLASTAPCSVTAARSPE
jgi:hypothetical protein